MQEPSFQVTLKDRNYLSCIYDLVMAAGQLFYILLTICLEHLSFNFNFHGIPEISGGRSIHPSVPHSYHLPGSKKPWQLHWFDAELTFKVVSSWTSWEREGNFHTLAKVIDLLLKTFKPSKRLKEIQQIVSFDHNMKVLVIWILES